MQICEVGELGKNDIFQNLFLKKFGNHLVPPKWVNRLDSKVFLLNFMPFF